MPSQSKPLPATVFQSFEERSETDKVAARVKYLRQAMKNAQVDGYLLPRGDMFRGENVPAHDQRLAWLTGFTGSAGLAVIGQDKAALFVDGRYTLQAPTQTDTTVFEVVEAMPSAVAGELTNYVPEGGKIGFDPWVHAPREIATMQAALKNNAALVPTANLVDQIWQEGRPKIQYHPIEFLGDNRAGVASGRKLEELRKQMDAEQADAVFLSMPESVCWLFNIRGRDVPETPFVLAYALIPASGKPTVFVDMKKVDAQALTQATDFSFADLASVELTLDELAKAESRIWYDPATCPVAITGAIAVGDVKHIEKSDPISVPKSRKNNAELAGMREAHRRDGVAMVRFLAWLDAEAPSGKLTEIDIVAKLEAIRRDDDTLVDISFETISGSGPNGAIVHYRVSEKSNRTLIPGDLMLVDSGGQYLSGTTDITRTIAAGPVSAVQKDRYTRVLKGMIDLSMLHFPNGVTGAHVDVLARQHLWQVGLNYSHGTGHGVGAFLSVHEGPVGISPRSTTAPLHPGNILSIEPGFYQTGEFGIRIENLVHVKTSDIDEKYCQFETLTLAPIDTRLVDVDLLTADERAWLNAYHERVAREIGPLVSGADKTWLERVTLPI